ncbi:hypothetical protein [Phnomibacter sp. MR]|uniref:hypothetical protein n=1 Tax=Phnomibacter sp. MR TaxID=3042318 RepID=UPI003A800AEE
MKAIKKCAVIFLLCWFSAAYAQPASVVSGYYITSSFDTIPAQIQLPQYTLSKKVMLSKLTDKVVIIDSINKSTVFKVHDINGFGFSYNENSYHFLSKNFGRENALSASTHRFYQAIILGPKSNLFHAATNVDGNDRTIGMIYFVEIPNGPSTAIYLFARTKPEFIKNLLKRFFKDYGGVHTIIDNKFEGTIFETWPNDILEIVQRVNEL